MGKSGDRTRVLLCGLGAMGSGMASMLLENPDVEIVAAIARRSSKAGKDLGEVIGKSPTGVKVTSDIDEAFRSKPDIVLQSTASFVSEVFPEIEIALEHDANVITMRRNGVSWAASEELSDKIDRLAKERARPCWGRINPGLYWIPS